MEILAIIGGSILAVCAVAIIFFVTLQTEKSDGISGAIMGNTGLVAGKAGSNEEKLANLTKILCIAFFALALLVNIFALIANK